MALMDILSGGYNTLDTYMKNNPGALQTILGGAATAFAPEDTWQNKLGLLGAGLGQANILEQQRQTEDRRNKALVSNLPTPPGQDGPDKITLDADGIKTEQKFEEPEDKSQYVNLSNKNLDTRELAKGLGPTPAAKEPAAAGGRGALSPETNALLSMLGSYNNVPGASIRFLDPAQGMEILKMGSENDSSMRSFIANLAATEASQANSRRTADTASKTYDYNIKKLAADMGEDERKLGQKIKFLKDNKVPINERVISQLAGIDDKVMRNESQNIAKIAYEMNGLVPEQELTAEQATKVGETFISLLTQASAAKTKDKTPTPVSWKNAADYVSSRFGKKDAQGQFFISPELQGKHRIAQKALVKLQQSDDIEPLDAVNKAEEYANGVEAKFWSNMDTIAELNISNKEKEKLKKQVEEKYKKQFGYLPMIRPAR